MIKTARPSTTSAATPDAFQHIQLDKQRLELENAKQELVLVKRQLAEKDDVILQLKTAVRKLHETLAKKEKDLQAVFTVLRAPQDADLTKTRKHELIERLIVDAQQRATASEALAEERKRALDKLRYSRKFLRFQELEVEIDECTAEIERLKRVTTAAGTVVGKLRVSTTSQPVVPIVDSKTRLAVGKPTRLASSSSSSNQVSAPVQPSGHVGVTIREPSDPDLREGFVSKARRRAIEADYYKQVRLAELEAECELKENVRIRAAREARRMRTAAEQQRQQQEMSRAKMALALARSPVASGRRRSRVKEQLTGGDDFPASKEEPPTEASVDPDPVSSASDDGKLMGSGGRANGRVKGGGGGIPEPSGPVDSNEAMSSSDSVTTSRVIDGVRGDLSIELMAKTAGGNDPVQRSALPVVLETEKETVLATESAEVTMTEPSLSVETLPVIVEPQAGEVASEEPTSQPSAAQDVSDSEEPPHTMEQPLHTDPDVGDNADESPPSSPMPALPTGDSKPTEAGSNTDKLAMYEEEEFDDNGEEEEAEETGAVETHGSIGASGQVESIPLAEDTPTTQVTADTEDHDAVRLGDIGVADANIDGGLSHLTPEEALKHDEKVPVKPEDQLSLVDEAAIPQVFKDGDALIAQQQNDIPASEEISRCTETSIVDIGTSIVGDDEAAEESLEDLPGAAVAFELSNATLDVPTEPKIERDAEVNPTQAPALTENTTVDQVVNNHERDQVTTPRAYTDEAQVPSEPVEVVVLTPPHDAEAYGGDEDEGVAQDELHDTEVTGEIPAGVLLGSRSAGSEDAGIEGLEALEPVPTVQESDSVSGNSAAGVATAADDFVTHEGRGDGESVDDADPVASTREPDDLADPVAPVPDQPAEKITSQEGDTPTQGDGDTPPTTARSMEDEVYTPEFVSPREDDSVD